MGNNADRFWKFIAKRASQKVSICSASKIKFRAASQQDKVTKLKYSAYGLGEASRVWKKLLFKTITNLGLEELKVTSSVFAKESLVIFCSVDDLIMFAWKESEIDNVKRGLKNRFKLNDLGKPNRFLGIGFKWARHGSLPMTHIQRIEKLLWDTGTSDAKAADSRTDLSQTVKNKKDCRLNEEESTIFRGIVGSLMFLARKPGPTWV